jgi:excisionase family DNA binding protein
MDADRIMNAQEAADYLRLTNGALYMACARGQLPAIRWGRRLRFRKTDLDRFLAARTIEPTQAPNPDGKRGAA